MQSSLRPKSDVRYVKADDVEEVAKNEEIASGCFLTTVIENHSRFNCLLHHREAMKIGVSGSLANRQQSATNHRAINAKVH